VELPEKQGLKRHRNSSGQENCSRVAVELPEKQGLKLYYLLFIWDCPPRCSGTSRKTRIETLL